VPSSPRKLLSCSPPESSQISEFRDKKLETLGKIIAGPRSGQTKPVWSDEEVEKLKALWPDHSASAIAKQLGRKHNALKSKIQNLSLKKSALQP
jgi:hypothetical protein